MAQMKKLPTFVGKHGYNLRTFDTSDTPSSLEVNKIKFTNTFPGW